MKPTKFCSCAMSALATVLLLHNPAAAENNAAEEDVVTLPTIEMTESKDTINKISQSDMERKTAISIIDALQGTNGVYVQKSGGRNESYISIRGSNRYQVGMYLDDIPVTTAYRNEYDYADVLTFGLESIEVSKGYSSPLLASNNNLGGAVNLRTAKPKKELEFTAKYLNFFDRRIHDQGRFAGLSIGTRQEKYYIKCTAAYENQDFFTLPASFEEAPYQGTGRRKNSDRQSMNAHVIAGWTPTEDFDIMVGYNYQHTKRGQPFDASKAKEKGVPYERFWYWNSYDTSRLYLNADFNFTRKAHLKLLAYYDWHQDSSSDYSDVHMDKHSYADKKYDQYTVGGQAVFDYKFNKANQLSLSAGYRLLSHKEYDDYDVTYAKGSKQKLTKYTTGECLEERIEEGYWDLGVEYKYKPIENLTLVFGGSLSSMTPMTMESRNTKTDKMESYKDGLDDTKTLFNYQVGAFYDIAKGHEVYATFAKKSRFATMRERYYRNSGVPANPDIDPEQAFHYELGYKGLVGNWLKINTDVFYSDVYDKIESRGPKGAMYFDNIGHAIFYGYELGLEAAVNEYLDLGATFNFMHWENCSDDTKLTGLPEFTSNIYAVIKPFEGLAIIPQVNISSSFYWKSDEDDVSYRRSPAFATADLKVTYDFNEHFSIEAGVKNIFDAEYAYDAYYPEPGRNFFLGATAKF